MYNPHRNLLASLEDHPLTEIQLRLNPFQLILLRDSAAGDIKQREQGEKEATFRFFPSRCKNHLSPLSPSIKKGTNSPRIAPFCFLCKFPPQFREKPAKEVIDRLRGYIKQHSEKDRLCSHPFLLRC